MEKTKKYLEAQVMAKRSELDAANAEADELLKKNEATEDEKELEEIGEEAKALQEKIAQLKAELAEAEAALAELEEKPAEEAPKAEEEPKEMEEPRQRSLKQITEKRGINIMENKQIEERAAKFVESGRMMLDTTEQRSTLISGGTIATPTGVSGINDAHNYVSSIVDLVKVVDCKGMGSNKVAYLAAGSSAAAATEGSAAAASDPTFGFVTITPSNTALVSYLSNQVRKQSPLNYEAKVKECAFNALRAKAAQIITSKIAASALTASVNATVTSSKGVIDATTLRKLVLAYGGNENVIGEGVLFLNKTDLIAFGDVRGANEKKAVYEIIPDTANPNTGIIKDGGLSVKYCINSNCTACAGTAQGTADVKTMFYGQPHNAELDLFGDYEVAVSEDYKFAENMLSVRGTADLGADVIVKDGFVFLTIPKTAA